MPGIGLFKRRLEKESDAISLAISIAAKEYDIDVAIIKTLETKYHGETGDWYVALGWNETKVVIRMDSVLGKHIETKKI